MRARHLLRRLATASDQFDPRMSDRIGIHILPEDFEEFRKMLSGAKAFAKTYASWLDESIKGLPPARVVTIRPQEFSLYCLQTGQQPSLRALNAFAVEKARDTAGGKQ